MQNPNEDYLNSIIDREFRLAMKPVSPSDSFNKDLMKRIALQQEFEREDIKGDKLAKGIITSITGILITLAGLIAYFILKAPKENVSDGVVLERTSNFLEIFSMRFLSTLGLDSAGSIILAVITLGVIVVLYNRMDRLIFKKR